MWFKNIMNGILQFTGKYRGNMSFQQNAFQIYKVLSKENKLSAKWL